MNSIIKRFGLPVCITAALLMQGCDKKTEPAKQDSEISPDDRVMKELSSEPVKAFPKTAQDPADIQALLDYDQRFTAVSDQMEDELMQMKESGSLTPAFAAERKRDNIQSALTMLKALDLKTQQGRYIQGLIYQYWDNQRVLLETAASQPASEHDRQPDDQIKGLGQFLHAQEQLEHWQGQYPELKSVPAAAKEE